MYRIRDSRELVWTKVEIKVKKGWESNGEEEIKCLCFLKQINVIYIYIYIRNCLYLSSFLKKICYIVLLGVNLKLFAIY